MKLTCIKGFPGGSVGKESTCNAGDLGLIPGLGRSPGGRHGNPSQYSCLENPHGQRSLVGCSSWGCKESDRTEQLSTHKVHSSNCSVNVSHYYYCCCCCYDHHHVPRNWSRATQLMKWQSLIQMQAQVTPKPMHFPLPTNICEAQKWPLFVNILGKPSQEFLF